MHAWERRKERRSNAGEVEGLQRAESDNAACKQHGAWRDCRNGESEVGSDSVLGRLSPTHLIRIVKEEFCAAFQYRVKLKHYFLFYLHTTKS